MKFIPVSFPPTWQVLGSLFYAYYVFVRLCIPQFHSISLQPFDLRAMVLCVFNSILPGKISHPCLQKKMLPLIFKLDLP